MRSSGLGGGVLLYTERALLTLFRRDRFQAGPQGLLPLVRGMKLCMQHTYVSLVRAWLSPVCCCAAYLDLVLGFCVFLYVECVHAGSRPVACRYYYRTRTLVSLHLGSSSAQLAG